MPGFVEALLDRADLTETFRAFARRSDLVNIQQGIDAVGLNVKNYGLKGDGITVEDRAKFQTLLDDIPKVAGDPSGATIYWPRGEYIINDSWLDADLSILPFKSRQYLTMQGPVANVGTEPATTGAGPARIIYKGNAAARFIDARSTDAFTMRGLTVVHDAAWGGDLVDFSHDPVSGADANGMLITGCALAGYLQNTCVLIRLRNAIFGNIIGNYLGRSAKAIQGRNNVGASVAYSNAHWIAQNIFLRCNEAIVNAGEMWAAVFNGFEGTGGNIQHAYLDDLTTVAQSGPFLFAFNWTGDAFSAVPGHWIDSGINDMGLIAIGNFVPQKRFAKLAGGANPLLMLSTGLGAAADYLVDMGAVQQRNRFLLGVDANGISSAVDPILNWDQVLQGIRMGRWGATDGTRGYDEIIPMNGPFTRSGKFPTVSGVNAGVGIVGGAGGVTFIGNNNNDTAFAISFTRDAGAGGLASDAIQITLNKSQPSGYTIRVRGLVARNQDTGRNIQKFYVTPVAANQINIGFADPLPANLTYQLFVEIG